jgi:metallopeptidase MepB
MDTQLTLKQAYHNPDGSYFHPSCAFVMNYPKPTPTKPTLLSLWAVSKMLHELGHLLQTLLGRVEHADLGFVDFDFGEAPCIMLEHLIDHPAILQELSHHYSYLSPEHREAWVAKHPGQHHPDSEGEKQQPPIQLPLDAISSSLLLNPDSRAKRKDAVDTQIFNLFMAAYDIRVHSPADRAELEAMDLAEEFNRMHAEITGMHGGEALGEGWGWAQGQSVFRMIVGGYDAGYYTYLL